MENDLRNGPMAWYYIFTAWVLAAVASGGSFFFSEVMEFLPCSLCWYQRIFMYPLVLIFLVGSFPVNRSVFNYSMPLIICGWLIALYHNFLHWGIIPESASPCIQGAPCTAIWIDWLGFITIPLLSLTAFTLLGIIMILFYRRFIR